MNGLSESEREALASVATYCRDTECPCGGLAATTALTATVDQIATARADAAVRAALEAAAEAVESRITRNIGGHPFADRDRGLREAARIVRAAKPPP